jgi:hypothetical protein
MKVFSRIVLAAVAAGSCAAAGAQYSDSADMERRARNREEAIANHERMQQRTDMQRHDTQRNKSQDASPTVGQRIDQGTQATSDFTHRQLNKMRNFGERQNSRYVKPTPGTPEPDKAPHAIGK